MSYVADPSKEMCIPHHDYEFFDGQFHIPLRGNSHIAMVDGNSELHIMTEDGSIWYMNDSTYGHWIQPYEGKDRLEFCVWNGPKPYYFKECYMNAITDDYARYVDKDHPDSIKARQIAKRSALNGETKHREQ